MAIIEFPPVETADENGLLAIGGDLEVPSLILAYSQGIFPWPIDEESLLWFAPPERAVLYYDELHISKSFQRFLNKTSYTTKKNQDFPEIIQACASTPRKEEAGTWITNEMISAYTDFFNAGFIDCIGVYDNNELIGGIYGVKTPKMFSAESMFHTKSNASKFALYTLVQELKKTNYPFLDCQIQNKFLKTLGVREISREEFSAYL